MFEIVPESKGFYTIKDVPIFEEHDTRGYKCDESWLRAAKANADKLKKAGYRSMIIVGHNVKGQEKPAGGFLDDLELRKVRRESDGKLITRMYASLKRVPEWLKEKILRNEYPNRSVEVLPTSKRILCMALLGGTTPHFALPQMSYNHTNEPSEWSSWYSADGEVEHVAPHGVFEKQVLAPVQLLELRNIANNRKWGTGYTGNDDQGDAAEAARQLEEEGRSIPPMKIGGVHLNQFKSEHMNKILSGSYENQEYPTVYETSEGFVMVEDDRYYLVPEEYAEMLMVAEPEKYTVQGAVTTPPKPSFASRVGRAVADFKHASNVTPSYYR